MKILDDKFKRSGKRHITQSLIATVSFAVILLFINVFSNIAIVTALAASAFIVFAMPEEIIASPRNLIGGHMTALIIGMFISLSCRINMVEGFISDRYYYIIIASLAIGITMFVMVITNTEHPPACSTALGLAIHDWNADTIVFIITFVIGLSIIKYLLRNKLVNLTDINKSNNKAGIHDSDEDEITYRKAA